MTLDASAYTLFAVLGVLAIVVIGMMIRDEIAASKKDFAEHPIPPIGHYDVKMVGGEIIRVAAHEYSIGKSGDLTLEVITKPARNGSVYVRPRPPGLTTVVAYAAGQWAEVSAACGYIDEATA